MKQIVLLAIGMCGPDLSTTEKNFAVSHKPKPIYDSLEQQGNSRTNATNGFRIAIYNTVMCRLAHLFDAADIRHHLMIHQKQQTQRDERRETAEDRRGVTDVMGLVRTLQLTILSTCLTINGKVARTVLVGINTNPNDWMNSIKLVHSSAKRILFLSLSILNTDALAELRSSCLN